MRIHVFLALLAFFCLAALPHSTVKADYIEQFDFTASGNIINVEYRLKPLPSAQHYYEVALRGKLDGRTLYPSSTYGDVGRVGTSEGLLRIFWDAAKDAGSLRGALTLDLEVRMFGPKQQEEHSEDPMSLVFVKGGTFEMGCTSEQQDCFSNERPVHEVTLSDFFIGKYEVTQAQWKSIMGSNPSYFKNCDQCPVESVSWEDVQEFLKKLNAQTGKPYRLPTEAEWEYAARGGGKKVLFGNGKNVADPNEINFDGDWNPTTYSVRGLDRGRTISVGSLNSPNALGLHDMSGNVSEWCDDWYSDYSSQFKNSSTGSARVHRGGGYNGHPQGCRVAFRYYFTPAKHTKNIGFRLACSH